MDIDEDEQNVKREKSYGINKKKAYTIKQKLDYIEDFKKLLAKKENVTEYSKTIGISKGCLYRWLKSEEEQY